MKLSIVIPTYNGVLFLDKLMSILTNQGLPQEEYEILFVDDCSTDDTREKLKELSKRISNMRYIFNEENKKLATTCNAGLNNAKGDYVWFVDQDDEIVTESAIKLLNTCYADALDVLLFNYSRIDEDNCLVDAPQVFMNSEVMDGRTFLHTYFDHSIVVYLFGYRWRALYRRQYLIDNMITFPDGLMHDDTTFIFQAIYSATRVKSIANNIYLYRVNLDSYTHSVKASRIYEQYILVADEELKMANRIKADDTGFIVQITADAQRKLNWYINKLSLLDYSERELGLRMLRACKNKEILSKMNFETRLIILPIIGDLYYVIYGMIYRMYRKFKR